VFPPAFANCKTCFDVPIFSISGTYVGRVTILAERDALILKFLNRWSAKIQWNFPTCFELLNKPSIHTAFKNQWADILEPEKVCQ